MIRLLSSGTRNHLAIGLLATTAAFLIALVALVCLFMPFFDHHEGTAAWVQAAGSLLIIAATAWISQRELQRVNAREEQAKNEMRKSCAVLARNCLEAIDGVIQRLPATPTSDYRGELKRAYIPSDLELIMDELAAIPLHKLGHTGLIVAVLELRATVGRIKRRLDVALEDPIGRVSRVDLNSVPRTNAFNKVASVIRCAEGHAAENELSAMASFTEHPRREVV